jgi:Flp pilus assembly protein TadG
VTCKEGHRRLRSTGGNLGCGGSVAAEFALVAPLLVLIATGIVDFGMLATRSAVLVATTRIGAEYAMSHPADALGIQNSMRNAMDFIPALSFPPSFTCTSECNDGTTIACSESCAANGRPGPNRLFVRISASQAFTPLVPWPGIPTSLTAATELRLR